MAKYSKIVFAPLLFTLTYLTTSHTFGFIQRSNHALFASHRHCDIIQHYRDKKIEVARKLKPSSLLSLKNNNQDHNDQINQRQNLVLIGGGHAHLQLIKAFNHKARPNHVNVTLIDVQSFASYSGMVPGCIANLYTPTETQIDLEALCQWATISFVQDQVESIDPQTRQISLRGGVGKNNDIIPYDVLSIDIGSTSRGVKSIPGVKEYTIPTRPISHLVSRIYALDEEIMKQMKNKHLYSQPMQVVVIGGGLAGIELAMAVHGRWDNLLQNNNDGDDDQLSLQITILNAGNDIVPHESEWCRMALQQKLNDKNIIIRHNCHVESIDKMEINLIQNNGGEGMTKTPYTFCLWATGAQAYDVAWEFQSKGIAVNNNGWIRVNRSLQSISHENIFAAGDCVTIESLSHPSSSSSLSTNEFESPPKAGVYAVRSGPILIENIYKYINDVINEDNDSDKRMVEYQPQDDFLKLIACGDGTSLGFRFGVPIEGNWVWQLKNHIDQMFMDLFRIEKLPSLNNRNCDMDTSQYDERQGSKKPLNPEDGATLLLRTDDNVDYKLAWDIIRDMMDDEIYRGDVIHYANIIRKKSTCKINI